MKLQWAREQKNVWFKLLGPMKRRSSKCCLLRLTSLNLNRFIRLFMVFHCSCAKQLIEDTIRRNASPVRMDEGGQGVVGAGSCSSLTSSNSDEVLPRANRNSILFPSAGGQQMAQPSYAVPTQHKSRASGVTGGNAVLLHSLSTNDASLGEYKYTVNIGQNSLKITGDCFDLVRVSCFASFHGGNATISFGTSIVCRSPNWFWMNISAALNSNRMWTRANPFWCIHRRRHRCQIQRCQRQHHKFHCRINWAPHHHSLTVALGWMCWPHRNSAANTRAALKTTMMFSSLKMMVSGGQYSVARFIWYFMENVPLSDSLTSASLTKSTSVTSNATASGPQPNGLTRSRRSHFSHGDANVDASKDTNNKVVGVRVTYEHERLVYFANSPHSWALPRDWSKMCDLYPSIVRNKVGECDSQNNNNNNYSNNYFGNVNNKFTTNSTAKFNNNNNTNPQFNTFRRRAFLMSE